MTRLFARKQDLGLEDKEMGNFSIRISTRERAIMELLHLVPQQQGFEEAAQLMEQLGTLRPEVVTSLLRTCSSIL